MRLTTRSIVTFVGLLLAVANVSSKRLAVTKPNATDATSFVGEASPPEEPLSLWYRRPARQWVEALAVGNGRLGAMVFGGV
ncbi:MAG TPA: glycoside hydrolase N-terminal domain-containing protein, partial [Blastocatellia bacterium]|nr:glycoside hydrolase N-terminal domain-containing protein [Blastocatellia bacterium]